MECAGTNLKNTTMDCVGTGVRVRACALCDKDMAPASCVRDLGTVCGAREGMCGREALSSKSG